MVYDGFMVERIDATLSKDGRLFIPTQFRCAIGLPDGGKVELALYNDTIQIVSKQIRIQEALKEIHALIPPDIQERIAKGNYTSDELIQERREEAHKEANKYGLSTDD